ncbi:MULTISPECIES: hypothetical protein [unclassified Schlesneria]|uniref:hypothetical protein n=1 Tax=unclassified Schlesneria TaxID=2762017 RepID=UPI002F2044E5
MLRLFYAKLQYQSSIGVLFIILAGCVPVASSPEPAMTAGELNALKDEKSTDKQGTVMPKLHPTIQSLEGVWRFPAASGELERHQELGLYHTLYSFQPPRRFEVKSTYYETVVDNDNPDSSPLVTYELLREGDIDISYGSFIFEGVTYTASFEDESTLLITLKPDGEGELERYRCHKLPSDSMAPVKLR